jgi:hypothetical protein
MSLWVFTTPTVTEAPFAWNNLHERYRMDRGVTVKQLAPGPNYTLERYAAYTDELGSENLPDQPSNPEVIPTGLNTFRGGYEWIVDDTTKSDLINSGIGITNANFVLVT